MPTTTCGKHRRVDVDNWVFHKTFVLVYDKVFDANLIAKTYMLLNNNHISSGQNLNANFKALERKGFRVLRPIDMRKDGAVVYLARSDKEDGGASYAVKNIARGLVPINFIVNEVECATAVRGHSSIAMLHDVCYDDHNVFLIQELCNGGTLFEAMSQRRMSWRSRLHALHSILSGIDFCHSNGVVLGGIRPTDVAYSVEHGRFKLVDFSSANLGCVGEDVANDIWTLGVLAHLLLYGKSIQFLNNNVLDIPLMATPQEVHFLHSALQTHPQKRASASDLLHILEGM